MTRVVQGCTRRQETQGEVLRWEECNAQEDWVHLDESVTVALTYYVWKYDLKTIEDKSWLELKPQLFFCKDSHRSIKIQDKWQTLWAAD